MKFAKIIFAAAIALIVLGCESPTSEEKDTTSLKIHSYSDSYDDPADISAENPIYAILDVEYPDGSSETVVTDALGWYDFGTVDAGIYTIKPRYMDSVSATEIVVGKGEAVTETILIPSITIAYYLFNGSTAPVDSRATRTILSKAIDRSAIITAVGGGSVVSPLVSLIPDGLSGTWSADAQQFTEDLTAAQTALGSGTIGLTISYNSNVDTSLNHAVATEVKAQWDVIDDSDSNSGTVTIDLNAMSWDAFLQLRDADKNFQVARGGWGYDSNNPLLMFKVQVNIETPEYTDLLSDAQTALDNKDFADFEAGILALNDYLVDSCLIIPLYQN